MHKLSIICTYVAAMTLGAYMISELKFHDHIAPWRWCLTTFWFIFFLNKIKFEQK